MWYFRIVEIHIAVKNALWRFCVVVNNKTHVVMQTARNVCPILAKFGFHRQIFISMSFSNLVKISNIGGAALV